MPTVYWPQNLTLRQKASGAISSVGRTDWLGFLDVLGRIEGDNKYEAKNSGGYIGIYL